MKIIRRAQVSLLLNLIIPLSVLAADPSKSLIDPGTATGKPVTSPEILKNFVGRVQNIILGVAGVIAVAMIIYGGVLYMTAGGNDEKIAKAKQTLTWAIGGLIVIISAVVVVNVVTIVLEAGK